MGSPFPYDYLVEQHKYILHLLIYSKLYLHTECIVILICDEQVCTLCIYILCPIFQICEHSAKHELCCMFVYLMVKVSMYDLTLSFK